MLMSLFGGLLIAAGILIAGASGLCSLAMLVSGVRNPSGLIAGVPVVLLFGGIPFGIGIFLVLAGVRLITGPRDNGPDHPRPWNPDTFD
jgi:hypothetical protein